MKIIIVTLFFIIFYLCIKNRKIKQSNKNFNYIINSMDELLCFKDENHKIVNANDSFLSIFGISHKYLGLTDDEIIKIKPDREDELNRCKAGDELVKKNGKSLRLEEKFLIDIDVYQTFDVVKTPIYDKNNKYIGLVIVGNDITDRQNAAKFKQMAEERDKMLVELRHYDEVRTDFFANLSHEFRTPLNLILSSLKMKEVYGKETTKYSIDKQIEYTKIIKQNTFRITRLINNIIDTTKFKAGHLECHLENYNIVESIESIVMSSIPMVKGNGLELIFDTNVEECIIAFDLEKMERIILNLLSNSIKFTEKGGKIFVNLIETENCLHIYIEDNGIGIPYEKQKYIFERFFQVNKSIVRDREGSGIGLNLVRAFVKVHNGEIGIINDGEKGTKIKISIPKFIIKESNIVKNIKKNSNVEIINVEFSDIYNINC